MKNLDPLHDKIETRKLKSLKLTSILFIEVIKNKAIKKIYIFGGNDKWYKLDPKLDLKLVYRIIA